MKYRKLGITELDVSEFSFVTWQVGEDTADVYDGGLSAAVGKVVRKEVRKYL